MAIKWTVNNQTGFYYAGDVKWTAGDVRWVPDAIDACLYPSSSVAYRAAVDVQDAVGVERHEFTEI